LELPHLPNGVATSLAGPEDPMVEQREPEELAALVRDLVEAAGWFAGRPEDLALALGAEEDMPWLPEWIENLVVDLGMGWPCRRGHGRCRGAHPGRPGQRFDLRP
jgi:hypothetical protein